MAEYSRPWPGTTIGDAGPFSAAQWFDVWLASDRSGGRLSRIADYDIGVFYAIANALEPTSNVTEIEVDTGASLVDGLYHENDATVSVPIPAAGAGDSRIDIVVVRKNYQQAITYTPGGGAPTVPPRTARITVVRGTEDAAPVAPSLTQDTTRTTYWDIPLAQVEVDDGGNLSDFTDLREFVDAETKTFSVNATGAYNTTDGTRIYFTSANGYQLPDNKECAVDTVFVIPNDFISDFTVGGRLWTAASGNAYVDMTVYKTACSGVWNGSSNSTGLVATAVVQNSFSCNISALDLTAVSVGTTINPIFTRLATSPNDTVNNSVFFITFYMTYFGWKK